MARRIAVWVCVPLLVVLGGCSSGTGGFGVYVYDHGMVEASFDFPGSSAEPEIQRVERLRLELEGDPPVHYIYAVVDNRKGDKAFHAGAIEVLNADGGEVNIQTAGLWLKSLATTAFPDRPLTKWWTLADEPSLSGIVPPGRRSSVVLVVLAGDVQIKSFRYTRDGTVLKRTKVIEVRFS